MVNYEIKRLIWRLENLRSESDIYSELCTWCCVIRRHVTEFQWVCVGSCVCVCVCAHAYVHVCVCAHAHPRVHMCKRIRDALTFLTALRPCHHSTYSTIIIIVLITCQHHSWVSKLPTWNQGYIQTASQAQAKDDFLLAKVSQEAVY